MRLNKRWLSVLDEYNFADEKAVMGDSARMEHLVGLLDLLYEKLAMFEEELAINASAPARFELKQRLKKSVLPDIRRYEDEYWLLYPLDSMTVTDFEAEKYLTQLETTAIAIEQELPAQSSSSLVPMLHELRSKLNTNQPAASKLKIALPLIPAIATYELEIDAGKKMYQVWNSLKSWIRK